MKTLWTSHLKTEEEKDRFRNSVLGHKEVLDRLRSLINERLRTVDAIETSVEKYKQPGWDAIQAHYNGVKADAKWVLDLINLDQKEVNNDDPDITLRRSGDRAANRPE